MSVETNLKNILSGLPNHVRLVAVSKIHPASVIMTAYNAGQRLFGENKVQEMIGKQALLPKDIEWHLIGHLQSNKVKNMVPFISMVHSVDSLNLLQTINKEAQKHNRIIDCLLQIFIASEDTKYGISPDEAHMILSSPEFRTFNNIRIRGLMGIATYTENKTRIRKEFKHLHLLFDELKQAYFSTDKHYNELSMGMTDDYQIAIEEGSTIIRIGTMIFGKRTYFKD